MERSVEDESATHAGRHRQIDEVPAAATRAEAPLREGRGVCIVLHVNGRAQRVSDESHERDVVPARHVGRPEDASLGLIEGPRSREPHHGEVAGRDSGLGQQRSRVRDDRLDVPVRVTRGRRGASAPRHDAPVAIAERERELGAPDIDPQR
jgi:hypothetical protein